MSKRIEVSGSGAAASRGGVATGKGGIAIGGDVHGNVTVTIQGENVREKELAYLGGLLTRYEHWRDHYTPLAGIAEVRAAVENGPRLDLPMPFIPHGFEKLVEHGYGERVEVRREPMDDLRTAVAEHRRIVLLGDPGCGKTTTLWRLAYDYAEAAKADGRAPLPLLIPLGSYTDDAPFDTHLARHLGPLASYLETYRASGRLILLLDGLNEMPQAAYAERVERIQDGLDRQPNELVVVTCRELDYVVKLERLQKVEVAPLDETRIRTFLCNYLGDTAGERLFWAMAGDKVHALWETWQGAGGTWDEFWTADEMPKRVYKKTSGAQDRLWEGIRKEHPPLLELGRNPYLLLMIAQVYAGAGGELPANRARLFLAFVDTLLGREKKRHPRERIAVEHQQDGLSALAYAMQEERGSGTTVEREWALAQLCQAVPGCDTERLLYLATSATLLDADETTVRFYHQLLQEYFAAQELGKRVAVGETLARYWPPERWWEPSGWEETVILLAGMKQDASALLDDLAAVNPLVAARCLLEGGAQAGDAAQRGISRELMGRMIDEKEQAAARVQAGNTLARLGDPREEVTTIEGIKFCHVPAGPFWMGEGSDKDLNEWLGYDYWMALYPVTVAQFQVFVDASGHEPSRQESLRDLPNHPVMLVSWYEACAFGEWLTQAWQEEGILPAGWSVRLPTEAEWEKAARGGIQVPEKVQVAPASRRPWMREFKVELVSNTNPARRYPWGEKEDPDRANYDKTNIGTTSPVGAFPGGASPYGCEEMSGNVWEWCHSLYKPYPYDLEDGRENPGESGLRVLRGGSFFDFEWSVRCADRSGYDPDGIDFIVGFRVVVAPGFVSGH